jgi:uncharacterized lipoprotein YmbA
MKRAGWSVHGPAFALAAALSGCASAPAQFYTLAATARPEAGASPAAYVVAVDGVALPATVDRPQFVVQKGPNRVAVDEFNRWAAPLASSVARTLAENLVVLLGTPRVVSGPLAPSFDPAYRVTVDIQRFESVPATYVGAETCKTCHEPEFKAWSGSHHQLAMQEANAASVLGDFANVKFRQHGVESTFFKRGDKFMVRTDGPDGKLADYEIAYTFGLYPLQQYLIPFPGGRYQTLPIAWDTRPKGEGGPALVPPLPEPEGRSSRTPCTGPASTRTGHCSVPSAIRPICARATTRPAIPIRPPSARSTSPANPATVRRPPMWTGPGTRRAPYDGAGRQGLPSLKSRWSEAWKFPSGRQVCRPRSPADPAGMNTCAACHARRSTLSEGGKAGAPLEDTPSPGDAHRPELSCRRSAARRGLCLGIVPAEQDVSERRDLHGLPRAAFAEAARRGQRAVHALSQRRRVRQPEAHHQHQAGGKGAQCVTCHMPTQNYMVIHARQDHSMRVPRPDLSLSLGSPNACNQCHIDRKPQWAASAMDKWYGKALARAAALRHDPARGRRRELRPCPACSSSRPARAAPAIIRATAATLAQPYVQPGNLPAARALLQDADPSVRIAALGMIAPADPLNRVLAPRRCSRTACAACASRPRNVLADVPDSQLPEGRRAARAGRDAGIRARAALEADWPSGQGQPRQPAPAPGTQRRGGCRFRARHRA